MSSSSLVIVADTREKNLQICHSFFLFLLSSLSFSLENNKPPLEFALGQASQCLHLMIDNGLGAAAFASVEELLKPNAPHSQPCIVQNNT